MNTNTKPKEKNVKTLFQDKTVMEVKVTTDYERYSFMYGNRNIKPAHKRKLKASFMIRQLPIPIVVTRKYEIIDGQHRYEVCKELKFPLYFIIIKEANLSDVQRLNEKVQKWSPNDYLHCYMSQGIEVYFKYKEFRDVFRFSHNESLTLLYKGKSAAYSGACQDFRSGDLKIDIKTGRILADKILLAEPYYPECRRRYYVLAMIECFKNKQYDHNLFIKKLSMQWAKMLNQSSTDDYLKIIEKIYNYQNRNKLRLFTY